MKHFYFNSSNYDYMECLRENKKFERVCDYPKFELDKIPLPIELGRITFGKCMLHLLIGRTRENNCPWCNCEPVTKSEGHKDSIYETWYLECPNCMSRGPSMVINTFMKYRDLESLNFDRDFLKLRYSDRKHWDDGFLNPYEEI